MAVDFGDRVAAAHARLLHDHAIQFSFTDQPTNAPAPAWLIALGEFLRAIGPFLGWIFWGGLALGVLFIVYKLAQPLLRGDRVARPGAMQLAEGLDRPTPGVARRLLADADRLAAEGRFGEGVRLLLRRSIDDIEDRRPRTVARAATAREISILPALSQSARGCFAEIARVVEGFAYAGRAVDADAYAHCRSVYETFALPDHWQG